MAAATMTSSNVPVTGEAKPQFPPPKTDKPRPHVCTTCGRSFARLEHLKRHERSHTKEKPFECPQCTRCFARRDLLLRHQQKLHQTGNTSSRPRGRRESASGAATGARGRKNSISSAAGGNNGTAASMRPRANTISHIDMAAFNSLMQSQRGGYHGHHPSLNSYGGMNGLDFRGMSNFGNHGNIHGLPKIDTHGLNNFNLNGGLRTAPILGDNFDFDKLFGTGSTINPAQLHFPGSSGPLSAFEGMHFAPTIEDEDALDWTGGLGETLMDANGEAIADGSSPSAISTASHSGFSEVMLDGSNMQHPAHTSAAMWNNSMLAATNMVNSSPFPVDPAMAAVFPELVGHPGSLLQSTEGQDHHMQDTFPFSNIQNLQGLNSTAGIPGMPNQYFQNHLFDSGVGSPSAMNGHGMNGAPKFSPLAKFAAQTITEATRNALLYSLSQPSKYGHTGRSYSQSSPISPGFGAQTSPAAASLPSNGDLQRYVSAFIMYFHPHMPFLHIPTLTFDTPSFTDNLRASHSHKNGIAGGGGCLILAMAAIGASYEFEHSVGRELFESSKRMIKQYLDERCVALKPTMGMGHEQFITPTWLVQAMLLNLIYGHQCGDKIAAESATIQCAALVSLAKAADLDKPDVDILEDQERSFRTRNPSVDVDMSEENSSPSSFKRAGSPESREEYADWFRWKSQEERKRTLYSVFVLSSLLVTAYNHQPRILNSELHMELPCEEDLWAADSVHSWQALGGMALANQKGITFADALTFLLTASQRSGGDRRRHSSIHQAFGSSVALEDVPDSDLKPSTFGCYILINALHVYIWETRQRHNGRLWKPQETEQMHAHIEPALRAWQSAWKSNPHHSLERPNPYGPLPADSIPLLDLAYVRLFVNLGRSKEAFWNRDFEQMAKELGEGSEIIQNAEASREDSTGPNGHIKVESNSNGATPQLSPGVNGMQDESGDIAGVLANSAKVPGQSTKRERHLRKAAFYAADSLAMSDRLGVTFAEFTSRELPIQSAMCTFDCAQVLAEWVATVQERVGRFLGIIGRDEIDYSQVPAIMLLEEEDVKLIRKINEILNHAEVKITFDAASMGTSPDAMLSSLASMKDSGDGSKILLMTSWMLSKAAVWGITKVMANAMNIHAEVLKRRAEASLEA